MPQRYPSWQLQEELWHAWRDYLLRWPWQWKCTFTLPDIIPPRSSRTLFFTWLKNLQATERMDLAGYVFACYSRRYQVSRKHPPHLHVLVFGRSRQPPGSGRTLVDVSHWQWRDRWQQIVQQRMRFISASRAKVFGGVCKVEVVDDLYKACSYHGQQQMGYKNVRVESESFGDDLLSREMNRCCDGHDNFDNLLDQEGQVIGAE